VVAAGRVGDGRLLQAKGRDYEVADLLGGDRELAAALAGALHVTVYLSPRDYHRVHMPWDGELRLMRHVPGRLFSVSPATTRRVPRLFARNERLVSLFEGPEGRFAMVLVGALFVGSMETVWAGKVTPPYGHEVTEHRYRDLHLDRGQEMGRFNMGSTVVLLMDLPGLDWGEAVAPGRHVRMGECLGRVGG
jgi:phosphatidylserine decarboxylase